MLVAIFARLLEDVLLYVVEQVLHVCLDTVDTYSFLFESVATHHLDSTVLKVTSSKHETHGHTLELVVGKLKSRALVLAIVVFHSYTLLAQCIHDGSYALADGSKLVGTLGDGDNNHLDGSELRRQHESVVVRVCHDERTDESGAHSP